MEDNHPARFAIQGDNGGDISPTRATLELGMTRGYSKFGDTLKLMAVRQLSKVDLGETTYEKPPTEEQPDARPSISPTYANR